MKLLVSAFAKNLLALLMVVGASAAMALPTPKDIESAVAAGQLSQAETMLREVIAEKPQSAKAHYELGEVLAREGKYHEAEQSLNKAKNIDPALKFASSPDKFNAVLSKVTAQVTGQSSSSGVAATAPASQASVATPAAAAQQTPAAGSHLSMGYIWLVVAGLVVLALVLRRRAAQNQNNMAMASAYPVNGGAAVAPRGFGTQYAPNAPGYGPMQQQPMGGGSTMTGAVIGGVAGLAAGYALSKAMEGGDHHAQSAGAAPAANSGGGFVPFDNNPAQPDFGSFDSGSGDNSWDSADSGGGSDDSW